MDWSSFWITTSEKYKLKVLFKVAQIAKIFEFALFLKDENPMTWVGLSANGISDIDQGIPPILALIWINTLFTIDLRFLPLEIVEVRIT